MKMSEKDTSEERYAQMPKAASPGGEDIEIGKKKKDTHPDATSCFVPFRIVFMISVGACP